MGFRVRGVIAALVVLCIVASGLAIAAGGYSLSSPDATSTPERSFTVQDREFTVDSSVTADPGDQISIDVSAPDESYRVYVYNADRETVAQSRHEGDATVSFDLSNYAPGSYVIAANSNAEGETMAVLPLLVRGYDVSATAPDDVTADESFEVSIDVTQTGASEAPATVSAVFVDETSEHTVEAAGSGGSYTATVDASDLSTGEYTVYATAQGNEQVFEGEEELLGLEAAGTVTVLDATETESETETTPTETETDSTPDDGGTGGAGSGGGSGGSGGGAPATGDDPTETQPDTQTATTPTDDQPTTTGSAATESTATDGSQTETAAEESGEGAITPATNTNEGETSGSDGDGFGVVHTIVGAIGLLAVVVLTARRRGA